MLTNPDLAVRLLQGFALLLLLGIPGIAIGYYQYRKGRLLTFHQLDGGFAAQVWVSIGCFALGLIGIVVFGILVLVEE